MSLLPTVNRWFDASAKETPPGAPPDRRLDWARCVPFFGIHLGCLAAFWVAFSPWAVLLAAGLYVVRMFAVTGFYHRYFSHRAFRTSRAFQFAMAVAGNTAVQRGPIWWASHHRHHHAHSDHEPDHHSPRWRGLLMSHVGWFMTRDAFPTKSSYVRDLARYPELRWLDRFDWVVPVLYLAALAAGGAAAERWAPGLGLTSMSAVVWGFFVSTVILYHATYTINSLAHRWGTRRYRTEDDSRNNGVLALLTLGEGWHNNHHEYPASARQGFYWWEIDLTYYMLRAMAAVGLIWDLKPVPERVLAEGRRS